MTEFKVGDTVQLKPESEWNNGSPLNPIDTDGEVTYIYPEAGLPIEVSWSDQGINDYNASSLFLVRSSECSEGDAPRPAPEVVNLDYPDYDFKINLEGMSDVEKGLAEDWLIEAVRSRDGETRHAMGNLSVDTNFFGVVTDYENATIGVGYTQDTGFFYNHWKLPEIKLEFSTPTITGFSVDNSKKVLQLEEELATIRLQLKEKEAELESLK